MMTVRIAGSQPFLAVLAPYPADLMEAFAVSTAVNSPGRGAPLTAGALSGYYPGTMPDALLAVPLLAAIVDPRLAEPLRLLAEVGARDTTEELLGPVCEPAPPHGRR